MTAQAPTLGQPATPILLFDGDCGLCDRWVRFVAARDRGGAFRFAPLQGATGRALVARSGIDPDDLASMVVIVGGTVHRRSDAVLAVLARLGLPWRLAALGALVPARLRDGLYDVVAAWRRRLFPAPTSCLVASPALRGRILDDVVRTP